MLSLWPGAADRGVATFTVDGWRDDDLADPEETMTRLHAELAAGRDPELPGAVRASLGLGTTEADVDALVAALHEVVVPLRVAA